MSQISAYDKLNPAPQLQPLDWNFMAKAKELQDNRQGKLIDLLGDEGSKLPLEGGYATQEVAKEYNKNINSVLESFKDRIVKGENPMKVYADLRSAASKIHTDPIYQNIQADRAKKDEIDRRLKSDPLYRGVQNYFDPTSQSFKQVTAEDLASGKYNPESWYKHIMPGNAFEENSPIYKQIIADQTRKYDPTTTEQFYDPAGNFVVRSTTTGKTLETITPEKVFDIGKKMAYGNESGFMDLPNNQYITAKMQREHPEADPRELAADLFRDNYVGYYTKELELQPKITQSTIKDPTKNDDGSDLSPNPITNAFDTASTQGVATVSDINAIAAIMGGHGVNEQEGTFKVSLAGDPTILKLAPTGSDPKTEESLSKVKAYNKYKNLVTEVAESNHAKVNSATFLSNMWAIGGEYSKVLTEAGKKEFIKKLGLGITPQQMEKLKEVVIENKKNGIDLTDPNSRNSIELLATDPKLSTAADLSIGLENAKGTVNFRPSRENNLGTTDNEEFTIDGNAEKTAGEITFILGKGKEEIGKDRLAEAEKQGIIVRVGTNPQTQEGIYEVPISKVVKTDIAAATNNYYTYTDNPNLAKEVKGQYDKVTKQWYPGFTQKTAAAKLVKPFVEADADGFISGLEAGISNITDAPYKESLTRGLEIARNLLSQKTKAGKLQAMQALGATLNALNKQLKEEGKQPIKLK